MDDCFIITMMVKIFILSYFSLKELQFPCSAHETFQFDTIGPFAPPPDSGNMSQRQLWGFKSTIAGAASLCRTSPLCPRVMPFSPSIAPKAAAAHRCTQQPWQETSLSLPPTGHHRHVRAAMLPSHLICPLPFVVISPRHVPL